MCVCVCVCVYVCVCVCVYVSVCEKRWVGWGLKSLPGMVRMWGEGMKWGRPEEMKAWVGGWRWERRPLLPLKNKRPARSMDWGPLGTGSTEGGRLNMIEFSVALPSKGRHCTRNARPPTHPCGCYPCNPISDCESSWNMETGVLCLEMATDGMKWQLQLAFFSWFLVSGVLFQVILSIIQIFKVIFPLKYENDLRCNISISKIIASQNFLQTVSPGGRSN